MTGDTETHEEPHRTFFRRVELRIPAEQRLTIYQSMLESSHMDIEYSSLLLLAGRIALFGLLENSAVVLFTLSIPLFLTLRKAAVEVAIRSSVRNILSSAFQEHESSISHLDFSHVHNGLLIRAASGAPARPSLSLSASQNQIAPLCRAATHTAPVPQGASKAGKRRSASPQH